MKRFKNLLQTLLIRNYSYKITRLNLIRGLGLIYANVFIIIFFQGLALWGSNGLLPIQSSGSIELFANFPSLFIFLNIDQWLKPLSALGILCSIAMISGRANLPLLFVVWVIQLSLVNSGQLFYGYGWEILILEVTFLCFFLVPVINWNLRSTSNQPPLAAIWFLRWTLFRLMFGAGLIKIRGDDCWRDLTCLIYHYETQPNPHPLSFFYHHMPAWFHYGGTLFNHFAELIVPFAYFGNQKMRHWAAYITILFQAIIISSGNLSWLNWLTIVLAITLLDDSFWTTKAAIVPSPKPPLWKFVATAIFVGWGLYLSLPAFRNLISDQQRMNTSYDNWHFINSYGAFGSIGKERFEVIIKATNENSITASTQWQEYQLPCAPSSLDRRPCLITPYHYHIDWQIWFSAMRPALQEEWLFRLAVRLLENDNEITRQFSHVPFKEERPTFIKMDLYKYQFADFNNWPKAWWKRQFVSEYMPPISLQTPLAQKFAKPK